MGHEVGRQVAMDEEETAGSIRVVRAHQSHEVGRQPSMDEEETAGSSGTGGS